MAFVRPTSLLPLVETIVTIQRDWGDRSDRKHARMKYLVEERGIPWFRAQLAQRLGWAPAEPRPIQVEGVDDHLGWHAQGDDRWFLGVHVENGRIKDRGGLRMKEAFRLLCERYRPGVRLTPQQNVLFTDIAEGDKSPIDALLRSCRVPAVAEISNALRYAMACPALPTCGLALSDAERALPTVVRGIERELARRGLDDERISIRMTGCPNGCTRPYLGDIGLVGRTLDRYNIYLGGDFEGTRLNQPYAEMVPTEQLVEALVPLFEHYREDRTPGERFGDYCWRVGIDRLRELASAAGVQAF